MPEFLKVFAITLGLILATWGLFHQLIVGGAATMFKNITEHEARLFVMSWVAQGAFMSFSGLLVALMIFFHGIYNEAVHTMLIISGIAMVLLSLHVLVSGFRTTVKPIRIGAIIELITGVYILLLVFIVQII